MFREANLQMRRAEELGIAERIRLMGFRSPVETWIRAVDILLVPAVREPFGRTLIEAMFLGTPVVATNHGGNSEAIEDGLNGFLVQADQPDTFVDPVYRLLTDEACRKKIVETARAQALASYGLERHVSKLNGIYRELLQSPRHRKVLALQS